MSISTGMRLPTSQEFFEGETRLETNTRALLGGADHAGRILVTLSAEAAQDTARLVRALDHCRPGSPVVMGAVDPHHIGWRPIRRRGRAGHQSVQCRLDGGERDLRWRWSAAHPGPFVWELAV
jgi:hypothetical protein